MTMATTYNRQRGETVTIAVADDGATNGGESAVKCHLRAVAPGQSAPLPSTPVAATMVVTFRAADSNFPVGWWLGLDAAACLALAPGRYMLDLKIPVGGGVVVTDPAFLVVLEPATI